MRKQWTLGRKGESSCDDPPSGRRRLNNDRLSPGPGAHTSPYRLSAASGEKMNQMPNAKNRAKRNFVCRQWTTGRGCESSYDAQSFGRRKLNSDTLSPDPVAHTSPYRLSAVLGERMNQIPHAKNRPKPNPVCKQRSTGREVESACDAASSGKRKLSSYTLTPSPAAHTSPYRLSAVSGEGMNQIPTLEITNRNSRIRQSPDHPITRFPAPTVTHSPLSVIGIVR